MCSWCNFQIFLKLLATIPVAPVITGITVHFRFHIRFISIPKLLYFNFFSASFCTIFLSAGIAKSVSVHVFSFFVFNYYIWSICCNFSVCVYCLIQQHCDISLFIHWLGHVCVPFIIIIIIIIIVVVVVVVVVLMKI